MVSTTYIIGVDPTFCNDRAKMNLNVWVLIIYYREQIKSENITMMINLLLLLSEMDLVRCVFIKFSNNK